MWKKICEKPLWKFFGILPTFWVGFSCSFIHLYFKSSYACFCSYSYIFDYPEFRMILKFRALRMPDLNMYCSRKHRSDYLCVCKVWIYIEARLTSTDEISKLPLISFDICWPARKKSFFINRDWLLVKSKSFPLPMAHRAAPISVSIALGYASVNAVNATAGGWSTGSSASYTFPLHSHMSSARREGSEYHFKSLWYDSAGARTHDLPVVRQKL